MDECGIYGVIYTEDTLSGKIADGGQIQGRLQSEATLIGKVGFPKCDYPSPYGGEYEVTPRLYEQYLDTDGKYMEDDVTVFEIPITRTSNPYGGQTVVIG